MLNTVEIMKHNPKEFGGSQPYRLSSLAIAERLCCARFCGAPGRIQVHITGDGFRILCGRHAVLMNAMILGVLGDKSPMLEVQMLATRLGVNWEEFLKTEPKHPTTPESFICLNCGGGYVAETTGMFTGKRYIHTCGR